MRGHQPDYQHRLFINNFNSDKQYNYMKTYNINSINPYSRCDPSFLTTLFLLRRTEGADEKIAEGLPAVIGKVAGAGADKRI